MMKLTIFALCLVAAWAAPAEHDVIPIVSQESDVGVDGTYHYSYESGDGSSAKQVGELKGDKDNQGASVVGSYDYKNPEGKTVHVEYTADANGFVAHGDGILETPAYIVRALEWAAQHPYKEEEHKH